MAAAGILHKTYVLSLVMATAVHFSSASLHSPVIRADADEVSRKLDEISAKHSVLAGASRAASAERPQPPTAPDSVAVQLTTVSRWGNFDSYITISFRSSKNSALTDPGPQTLVVDTGNSMLIVPNGEDLTGLPDYTILGRATEPWGCPANVVKGPIEIATIDGGTYTLEDCIFYACTGDKQGGGRTANFGAGRVTPWSASGWNVVAGVTMRAPLAYNEAYPYAEFNYAPADAIFSDSDVAHVDTRSLLVLYASEPAGYTMLDTIKHLEWMSVVPSSLEIGGKQTRWPGTVKSPIAMVDTGGGPTFLSDPNGYVYKSQWRPTVTCPSWASTSVDCTCSSSNFTLTLNASGNPTSYSYTVDTTSLPSPVQGLTLVMCKYNNFMRGQQGMNIGGITALFNYILVDYSGSRVGFKPKKNKH